MAFEIEIVLGSGQCDKVANTRLRLLPVLPALDQQRVYADKET